MEEIINVNKKDIEECISWLDYCYTHIKRYYKEIYEKNKKFFDESQSFKLKLRMRKHITPQTFADLNDWFCCFNFGIEGFEFDNEMPQTSAELLSFSTNICWEYGYDFDESNKRIYKIS